MVAPQTSFASGGSDHTLADAIMPLACAFILWFVRIYLFGFPLACVLERVRPNACFRFLQVVVGLTA